MFGIEMSGNIENKCFRTSSFRKLSHDLYATILIHESLCSLRILDFKLVS